MYSMSFSSYKYLPIYTSRLDINASNKTVINLLYSLKLAWIKMEENLFETDFTWMDEVFSTQPSAFVSYSQNTLDETRGFESNNVNIKKRMREFLINNSAIVSQRNLEKERCEQNMMNERMRREKQRHNYMRLHSVLPPQTKRDKLSITIAAAREVEELKKRRQELERHKSEMSKMLGARETSSEGSEMEEAKVRINVAYPSSGVDSMLEVLKFLKQTSPPVRLIQSRFLPQQFSAALGIQIKGGAAEVENAIHRRLVQVEKRFRFQHVEASYMDGSV